MKKNDPMFEGDFKVGINTPKGIASYHIKLEYWNLFNVPEIERAPKYDFYSRDAVLEVAFFVKLLKPNLSMIRLLLISKSIRDKFF